MRREEMKRKPAKENKQIDGLFGRQTDKKLSKLHGIHTQRLRELNVINIKMPFELVKWQYNTTN